MNKMQWWLIRVSFILYLIENHYRSDITILVSAEYHDFVLAEQSPVGITNKMSTTDKCELCALKVVFDQHDLPKATKVEEYFKLLRGLQKEKIVAAGYSRRAHASSTGDGDKTEICAINSKYFMPNKKTKKCPNFILNTGQSTSEAISQYQAKKTQITARSANFITIISAFIAIIALGTTIYQAVWQNKSTTVSESTLLKIEVK